MSIRTFQWSYIFRVTWKTKKPRVGTNDASLQTIASHFQNERHNANIEGIGWTTKQLVSRKI